VNIEESIENLEPLEEGDTNKIYLTEDGELIKVFPDFSAPLVVQSIGSLLIGRLNYLKASDRIEAEVNIRKKMEELGVNYPEITSSGDNWLRVDYIDGKSLSSLIENKPSKSRIKGREVAELMKKLHRNDVILEDWDLNNILVRNGELFLVDLEYGRFSDRGIDRKIDPVNMLMVLRTLEPEIYSDFIQGFRQEYSISRIAVAASVPFALGWSIMNLDGEGLLNTLKSVSKDFSAISR
jgi:tRNA A-37 threonylcarbamoyl transferase component Bud32